MVGDVFVVVFFCAYAAVAVPGFWDRLKVRSEPSR